MKQIILSAFCAAWFCASAPGQNISKPANPNSIVYSEKGTHYKLTCEGDKLPVLFVNDKEVPSARLNDYAPIVSKLQADLFARQKAEARTRSAENEKQLNEIVNDLVAQQIIPSAGALVSFRLDQAGFMVNGHKQSFAVFSRFKSKYAVTDDKVYAFNDK